MVDGVVVSLSVILQLAAAALALRLARISGGRNAWFVLAAAFFLAALYDGITLYRPVSGGAVLPPDLPAELVALAMSALMLVGVAMLTPVVRSFRAQQAALAESEERLDAILGHMVDGVITIDAAGIVETFNPAAERLFGYAADEVIGRNVSMLTGAPHRGRHDSYLRRYLDTGVGRILGIGPRELVGRHRDGSEVAIDLSISEMAVGGRRVFIGVARDIAERKANDALLRQAQKMEVIGQLTGGVAHDFNNMLTAVMGNLDLLRGHIKGDSAAEKFHEVALRATHRGAELTQRLLAFSRRQTLAPEATDVNRRVPEMSDFIRRVIGEHIEIETVLAGGLWPAMVDPGQLDNALMNLAVNARDAMPEGGKLTIETANIRLDQAYADAHDEVTPGQYVMVAVTDAGCGMPPEVVARAFDPFFTTKEVGAGSGLGLSMVYGFVKQSGGHVKIYSEAGQGTTVKIYLPRAVHGRRDAPAGPTRRRAMASGSETVLVVEDEADVRAFVADALSALGYTVVEAADGPAALEILDRTPMIHLLLTDVVLPGGMNGRQVAEEVRRRRPGIAVLFTSGYTENAIVHHGRLDHGVELLAKPFTREALARAVRKALQGEG